MNREIMIQIYETMHFVLPVIEDYGSKEQLIAQHKVMTALEQELAKPEYDKLTAKFGERAKEYLEEANKSWQPEQKSISTNDHLCAMLRQVHDVLACTALPMKRKWVGLTDDEINDFDKKLRDNGDYCSLHFAWGISAKLKEKNGG